MRPSSEIQGHRKACRRYIALVLLAASYAISYCVILTSCRDDASSWYPAGKAEVASFYEFDTGGQGCLSATLEVTNKGKSGISSCSISISAKTTKLTYKRTFIKTIDIQPGGKVYFDIEILYSSAEERLMPEGLTIIGEFYY